MSVREFTPLFSWGFSLRRSKWLVPLFNNNVLNFGNSAVNGPYGWNNTQKRTKTTISEGITTSPQQQSNTVSQQTREKSTAIQQNAASETAMPILRETSIARPGSPRKPIETIITGMESLNIEVVESKKPHKETKEEKMKAMAEKYSKMTDGELIDAVQSGGIALHALETYLEPNRAVKIRRMYLAASTQREDIFNELPYEHYNFTQVKNKCCENVVGYVPVPVGIVGPYLIDGKEYQVPMATTEGALIASTARGAKAISMAGGATTVLVSDGMTRGPVLEMPSAAKAAQMKQWFANQENFNEVCSIFNSTSRFARLQETKIAIAGKHVYIRFKCTTGDAMGMNMISKAVNEVLKHMATVFPEMKIQAVSGNYCTDKKPSALNWIEGRGKSVVCDVTIPKEIVQKVLKVDVDTVVKTNTVKNLLGSAMAGSIGGMNAHASNIVTAIFLATGQDCAQNVESSNCLTFMEKTNEGDLYLSVTMPSIEVGTVGGGTQLAAQASCLNILGVKGANVQNPGQNAQQLARVVAATVMAGELNLVSALATNELVKAHMHLGRAQQTA